MNKPSVPVIYGEVLYDCFPDGNRVLGGAPFNVAWHCQAFGLAPLFISRVGRDPMGEQVRDAMQDWGMNVEGLQIDEIHPTGDVAVSFDNGEPAYDFVENSAWDFIDSKQLPELNEDTMVYHGSLALRNDVSADTLRHIKKITQAKVLLDVNLRAPFSSYSDQRSLFG